VKILQAIAAAVAVVAIIFGAFAFVQMNANPAQWPQEVRSVLVVFSVLFAAPAFVAVVVSE